MSHTTFMYFFEKTHTKNFSVFDARLPHRLVLILCLHHRTSTSLTLRVSRLHNTVGHTFLVLDCTVPTHFFVHSGTDQSPVTSSKASEVIDKKSRVKLCTASVTSFPRAASPRGGPVHSSEVPCGAVVTIGVLGYSVLLVPASCGRVHYLVTGTLESENEAIPNFYSMYNYCYYYRRHYG